MKFRNVCQRNVMVKGVLSKKDKKKYDTLDDAIEAARKINLSGKNVRKAVAYKCTTCHKYHVGRNMTMLTDRVIKRIKKHGRNSL